MISITTTRVAYTGDGTTVAFPVPFPFFAETDLEVIERVIATGAETVQSLGGQYSVTGGDGETGTVTAVAAPGATLQWIIRRLTARTQTVDFVSNDPLPAEQQEQAFDRDVMRAQELDELLSRAIRFPRSDDPALVAELPSSVARAGKFFAWDSNGNPTVSLGVTTTAITLPVSVANGGTGATDAAAARAALAAAGLADNNTLTGTTLFTASPTIRSVDPGVNGANLQLQHDKPTPAPNDVVGSLNYVADDDGGAADTVAQVRGLYTNVAAGAESASLELRTMQAGVRVTRATVGAGMQIGTPTGGDPGVGGINAQLIKLNNKAVIPLRYAKYSFTVASGSGGGNTVAAAWTDLTFNTEDVDADGIGTLASNRVTLGAGTYRARARASFYAVSADARAKLRLRNITDGTTTLVGGQVGATFDTNASGEAQLEGEFTIAATKVFALQYWTTNVNTGGLGLAITSGEPEVYRAIEYWKIS